MKTLLKILMVALIIAIALFAQTPDLILQREITPEYDAYLDSMETEYQKLLPEADDAQTMKAHMGLAIIQATRVYIDGDTLINDLEYLMEEIQNNIELSLEQTYADIFPLFAADNPNEFVLNLTEFFESGLYPVYRDSISEWLTENSQLADEIGQDIGYFGNKVDPLFDAFGEHIDSVFTGTADFEFRVKIMGSKYQDDMFVFSRTFFNRLEMIGELGEAMAETVGNGFTQIMDSLNCNSTAIDPGVVVVQEGLDSLNALIDSVQVLLINQPFAPLELELAWMDSLQKGIDEFDAILAGKTYPIGPESENKVIRPRGILESLAHPDGPTGVFKDFYRGGENQSYTFYNTFPQGITTEMYAMIASDIILNDYDTREEFEDHIHTYQANLKAKTGLKPDEHFGLALTLLYDLNEEFFGNVDDAIRIISEGRIDSLMDTYDWSDFDVQDQIDEIRCHVDQYIESEEPTNFVILTKEYGYSQNPYADPNPYVLDANSEFSLTFLAVPQVKIATAAIEKACEGLSKIGDVLNGLYSELDQMFILDLDPNYLDFSEVEGPMDVISILEQSNPEFLTVTDYGVAQFHKMGDKLEDSFNSLTIFFNNLTGLFEAMEPYQDDFGIDAPKMQGISTKSAEMAGSLHRDFANPDSTVIIDGERVNVSAWFDNPPTSFLVMMKNFFMGTDSTLGGMFPDRFKVGIAQENQALPTEFKLYPVYPNPFNPVANITFDLPQAADVKLCIVDLQGRVIEQIVNRRISAGQISYDWNASHYPSGIYFALLEVNGHRSIRKMTLLK